MQLSSKVVAVTGAGRGLGRAIATAFAARGANVAALDIDLGQLLDKGQDRVQFAAQMLHLAVGQGDPGQMGNSANGRRVDGHCRLRGEGAEISACDL